MEIIIVSSLSGAKGEYAIQCRAEDTVSDVIAKFCATQQMLEKNDLILRSEKRRFEKFERLIDLGVNPGDVLYMSRSTYIRLEENNEPKSRPNGLCCIICGLILLVLGLILLLILLLVTVAEQQLVNNYAVISDLSNTRSLTNTYQWKDRLNGTALIKQLDTCNSIPEGRTFANNIDELSHCLNATLGTIPSQSMQDTYVFAAAGDAARLMNPNSRATQEVQVRKLIQQYGFSLPKPLDQVRVLSAAEEAMSTWIGANFLISQSYSGIFPGPFSLSTGILNLGDAALEIAFESSSTIRNNQLRPKATNITLYGNTYLIETYEYMCYGLAEAFRRYRALLIQEQGPANAYFNDPCLPVGYKTRIEFFDVFQTSCTDYLRPTFASTVGYQFIGTNESHVCEDIIRNLFHCKQRSPSCPEPINRNILPTDMQYLALMNFVDEMSFFKLISKYDHVSMKAMRSAIDNYCSQWTPKSPDDAVHCFSGRYVYLLLTESNALGFDTAFDRIKFTKEINNAQVGWPIGWLLSESSVIPLAHVEASIYWYKTLSVGVFVFLLILCLLLIITGCVLISIGTALYSRRNQYESLS